MEFRQAKQDDLLPLLRMYEKIIQKMNAEGIPIWDDVYPCAYFAGDIENGRFFVAQEGDSLAAGFALCDSNDGQDAVGKAGGLRLLSGSSGGQPGVRRAGRGRTDAFLRNGSCQTKRGGVSAPFRGGLQPSGDRSVPKERVCPGWRRL